AAGESIPRRVDSTTGTGYRVPFDRAESEGSMRKRNMMMAAGLAATLAGCGGGGSITTPPTPTTTTTLRPQPTPSPEATPCPDGSCGNHKVVVRASRRLYLLFDQNR